MTLRMGSAQDSVSVYVCVALYHPGLSEILHPMGPCPADTKHNIYIVFMLEDYVKIMLDFMLECLVLLT